MTPDNYLLLTQKIKQLERQVRNGSGLQSSEPSARRSQLFPASPCSNDIDSSGAESDFRRRSEDPDYEDLFPMSLLQRADQ